MMADFRNLVMKILQDQQHLFKPRDVDPGPQLDGLKNAVLPLFHHGHFTDRKPLGKYPADARSDDGIADLDIFLMKGEIEGTAAAPLSLHDPPRPGTLDDAGYAAG